MAQELTVLLTNESGWEERFSGSGISFYGKAIPGGPITWIDGCFDH
jgi:hypothetical protein